MSDQQITLVGNITRDMELRFTTGGQAVANGSLATNRRFQKDGEWVEADPTFWNLTIWGKLGQNASASLQKGQRVIVTGRLDQWSYEDKEGQKRTAYDFVVDEIGPSLKWATAEVAKTERTTPSNQPRPAPSSGSHDPVYGDEEPF